MKNYMENVVVIDHPLVQHKLTLMRDKNTGTKDFRMLLNELSTLMAYEVTRDLPMEEVDIETPVASMRARVLAGRKLGIVPILRAGLGMAEGVMELIPAGRRKSRTYRALSRPRDAQACQLLLQAAR